MGKGDAPSTRTGGEGMSDDAEMNPYRVEPAVGGGIILLRYGFQVGEGHVDASGARDSVFETQDEAWAWAAEDAKAVKA